MATAREENPYEGGGGFGKFRRRPFRRSQTTPYDRPPTAVRNPSRNNGWLSKLVDPAQRLITYSANRLFSSVFRNRLTAPPPPPPPPETVPEVRENHHQESAITEEVANESNGKQKRVEVESSVQNNSSDGGGLTELEKLFKQKTFTRSEIDHLTELLRSRTVDSPIGEGKRTEVVPPDSTLPCEQKEEYPQTPVLENGIGSYLVSTPYVTSSVSIQDVASPAELAKSYMGSRPSKVAPSMLGLRSPPNEDPNLLKSQYFAHKSPIMSIVPRATTTLARVHENGIVPPRSRGRSAIYSMARTPYTRVHSGSTLKSARVGVEGEPSSSSQYALDHDMLSGSKQGALKRRSSVLDNDIGFFGPVRRIRHKSNLLSSKGLTSPHSGSHLSITRSGVGVDAARQPSSSMLKPILLGEVKHGHMKLSAENKDDAMPSTSFPPLHSKSSDTASKILQQLERLVSPNEKSSEMRLQAMNDKSSTKLSPSMLRGKALRSMETVDSSKLLDNIRDNDIDGSHGYLSASAQKLSKIEKVESGPSKVVSPDHGLIPLLTDADATVTRNQEISTVKLGDSSVTKPVSYPPQKKRAFHMSAHEDYLELDDDAYPNGSVSSFSTSGKAAAPTAVYDNSAAETTVQEMPPSSSVEMPSKSSIDGKSLVRTADGSIVDGKVNALTSVTSSIINTTIESTMGAVKASTHPIFGSDKSTSQNGSVGNPSLFNFGNKIVPSTELAGADAPSKESNKSGPVLGLEKAELSKEQSTDAPLVSFGINKNVDHVPQVPSFVFSSPVGGNSAGFKFGASSDSNLRCSTSPPPVAGAVDSMPKVGESDNADVKATVVTGSSAWSSEPAVSSAASPTSIFTFGNVSNKNTGPAVSSPIFSSPFPSVATNNFTSQNIFSSSSPAASSSATATSTSTGMTYSSPAIFASSNDSSSTQMMTSSSPTTSFFKFGSTPSPSASLPVPSSEPVETKSNQDAGFGNLGSTSFGSSSAVGNTGIGTFGFSSSATTTVNSKSPGSVPGTKTESVLGTLAPSTSGFATSTQSQSVAFGSSASSSLFGLTGNTAVSSGSSLFPSASSASNIFNFGATSGQSSPASSFGANPVNSNSHTSSTSFGLSSWQPGKSSPFGTSFSSSSSSTSGFSFGTTTPSVATTSSPMMFGSSTGASGPQFSFTSAVATTSTLPSFGSPSSAFAFGSTSVTNDQMSMEDSMAEDTVQATPPVTPIFGQQTAPVQSNFVFGGGSTPTGASPFQFGGQQSIAPQNPSPFQASGSLDFNAGGSFSLGTGGVDKSGRKIVKVKHKQRKK